MQNMRLSPSGKASSAIDICCSFSIWLRRQPSNQPAPEFIFAQNFYRISPASCNPANHSWFSTITLLFLILANSIKAHGNSFSRPCRQNQAKQNSLDRGVQ